MTVKNTTLENLVSAICESAGSGKDRAAAIDGPTSTPSPMCQAADAG